MADAVPARTEGGDVLTKRDFIAEMDEAIRAAMPDGDFVSAIVGHGLADRLREEDPELLTGYLLTKAGVVLTAEISERRRRTRAVARHQAPRGAFAAAAESYVSGETATLARFSTVRYVIDEDNTSRLLGDMTAADHLFVAREYDASAKEAAMLAAFHRAVAKKVGAKRTGDVFTEETYDRLLRSITGQADTEAA